MPPAERSALYILRIYFYHRTFSALPHDWLPTLEPGTSCRISTRAPAGETPRAHQGGAPRAGGQSPGCSGDVCAEPLRLEVLWKPEAFPLRGLGPPRTECVWVVASLARSQPVKESVCASQSAPSERMGCLGKELQQAVVS